MFQAGALEGQYFRKTGKLTDLSVQEILDCTITYGNMGCLGGSPALAFEYARDRKGIRSKTEYSHGSRTKICPHIVSDDDDHRSNKSFLVVNPNNEEALKAAVAYVGPVATNIHAFPNNFRFYSEGFVSPYLMRFI